MSVSAEAAEAEGELAVHSVVLHELVGAIAVWGAEIEGIVTVIFAFLMSGDERVARLLGRGQDFSWLRERCVALLDLVDDTADWKSDMLAAFDEARAAMENRNRVIHATWWPARDGGVIGARPRRYKPVEVFPVTAETLRGYYMQLTAAWSHLLVAFYAAAGIDPMRPEPGAAPRHDRRPSL